MTSKAKRRIVRDMRKMQHDAPPGITGEPMAENIMEWQAVIYGCVRARVAAAAARPGAPRLAREMHRPLCHQPGRHAVGGRDLWPPTLLRRGLPCQAAGRALPLACLPPER